jgi:hypothetical protein
MEPRAKKAEQFVAPIAEIVEQYGLNVLAANSALEQLVAIAMFRQKWMTAKRSPPRYHGFLKGQILERVQRIVMHERRNRSLRGKKMRRVFDDVAQMFAAILVLDVGGALASCLL